MTVKRQLSLVRLLFAVVLLCVGLALVRIGFWQPSWLSRGADIDFWGSGIGMIILGIAWILFPLLLPPLDHESKTGRDKAG